MSILTPDVQSVVISYLESLDSALGLGIAICLRYKEYGQAVSVTADPRCYRSSQEYFRAAASAAILKKCDWDVGLDPDGVALETWFSSERQCYRTNVRINSLNMGILVDPYDEALDSLLLAMRKIAGRILGSCPASFDGRFGPGATMSDPSRRCTVLDKISSTVTFTSDAAWYLVPFFSTKWGQNAGHSLKRVNGNKYFTVPKTGKTSRACAKEPSLNSYYQLGLGRAIRSRLKNAGIDLELNQDLHRELAKRSSVDDSFATIDLSSASDSMAFSLVERVIPSHWFDHLSDLRSPFTEVEGKRVRLEKFSSMGNGYTFELETLIFLSCCLAVCPWLTAGVDCFVYGDDIIVPSKDAERCITALGAIGFLINSEKTFLRGPFRESCGGDFFDGAPVRGHYLKAFPSSPGDWISLANGVRRVYEDLGISQDPKALGCWRLITAQIPKAFRFFGPKALGDLCIHDGPSAWVVRLSNSIRYIKVCLSRGAGGIPIERWDDETVYAAALYGFSPEDTWGSVDLDSRRRPRRWLVHRRDEPREWCAGWVPFS